jgi:hypothetical protein
VEIRSEECIGIPVNMEDNREAFSKAMWELEAQLTFYVLACQALSEPVLLSVPLTTILSITRVVRPYSA